MNALYNAVNTITAELLASPLINTVTTGDIEDVDLNKSTTFSLAHLIINSGVISGAIVTLNVSIILMDIVDDNVDNTQDVLNEMSAIGMSIVDSARRGTLNTALIQLEGDAQIELFTDRFENKVAGATVSFDVQLPTNMQIC